MVNVDDLSAGLYCPSQDGAVDEAEKTAAAAELAAKEQGLQDLLKRFEVRPVDTHSLGVSSNEYQDQDQSSRCFSHRCHRTWPSSRPRREGACALPSAALSW